MTGPPLADLAVNGDCCHCQRNTAAAWHYVYGPLCEWCWNKYAGEDEPVEML